MWPNCGFNISPGHPGVNGSNRPCWRIMLVWKITSDIDNNNKEFWTTVLVMPSEHAAWPYYMANYSHMGSVLRCLNTWKCSDRIIHVCNTLSVHFAVSTGILTIRALLNGDQLCGHIYAHLVWPNYSNCCCTTDKGILRLGGICQGVPRVELCLPKVCALISKQFQYQTFKVQITNLFSMI